MVIRDTDAPISDQFSLTSWLATLIRLNHNNTLLALVSDKAKKFRNDNLEKIVRLMYIEKVALWPFGRSEIHQALAAQSLTNKNHKLTMDSWEL
jgi:hypothetical protein